VEATYYRSEFFVRSHLHVQQNNKVVTEAIMELPQLEGPSRSRNDPASSITAGNFPKNAADQSHQFQFKLEI
jgi:hypothetical protein